MSIRVKPKPGKAFESAVAAMERSLARDPSVTEIEAPARLPDRGTGTLREHDVLVTHRVGHHLARTAIECRDRSHKVGVPDVEAFAAKCRDTSIDRAVIVSSTGFTKTALTKAKHENVRCHLLHAGGEALMGLQFGGTFLALHAPVASFGATLPVDAENWWILRDDGSPFDSDVGQYLEHFSGLPHERSPGFLNEVWYPIPCHNLYMRDNATGLNHRFRDFCCIVSSACTEHLSVPETLTYSDLLTDKVIARTTTMNIADIFSIKVVLPNGQL